MSCQTELNPKDFRAQDQEESKKEEKEKEGGVLVKEGEGKVKG